MTITFVSYTVLQKQVMSSSKIFSSLGVFEILRWAIHVLVSLFLSHLQTTPVLRLIGRSADPSSLRLQFWETGQAVRGKVSLDRLNDFLQKVRRIREGMGGASERWLECILSLFYPLPRLSTPSFRPEIYL